MLLFEDGAIQLLIVLVHQLPALLNAHSVLASLEGQLWLNSDRGLLSIRRQILSGIVDYLDMF